MAERVRKGEIGKPAKVVSNTIGGYHADPPKTATIEPRLKNGTWGDNICLSGGTICSFDIHMIDRRTLGLGTTARWPPWACRGSSGPIRTAGTIPTVTQ